MESNYTFNEEFEDFRKDAAEKSVCCEMVAGHVLRSQMTNDEGRRLCFMLGTLLEDYFIFRKIGDRAIFGPIDIAFDESNLFQPDLITVRGKKPDFKNDGKTIPKFVVEILSAGNVIYECLDKAIRYMEAGVGEYWLIDFNNQFVYTYSFQCGFEYKRYNFEQSIHSKYYSGFECCISDVMWADTGSLKELALFYRFKQEIYSGDRQEIVAETVPYYPEFDDRKYTAEDFYEWMKARKNMVRYTSMMELLFGNIREYAMPAFRHQNIRGNLYFTIKYFLRTERLPYQIFFAPIEVELKKMDLLDSVVTPDLFLIPKEEVITDNVYRGVPEWIVEIVSPATAVQDYIDKAQLYQYHGVQEYWIINDWKQQVMVLSYQERMDPEGDNVEVLIYNFDEEIPVKSLPGLKITMEEILKLP